MRLLGLTALLGGSCAAVACGNSFTASSAGDGGPDASSSGGDGAAGGVDAPGESSSSGGAPVEGGPGGDAGGSWCSTFGASYKFCEDFDETGQVQQFLSDYWPTYSQNGATFSFDTAANVPSPPNAFVVTTSKTNNVDALAIHAVPKLPVALASQRLEFDLRINQVANIGVASDAAFAAILFGTDVSHGAVALAIGPGSPPVMSVAYIEPSDGGIPGFGTSNAPQPFPQTNVWAGRFALAISYGASAGTSGACAQLFIGGQAQLNPCLALPASLAHPTDAFVALGMYSGGLGNSGNVAVEFDDVTYTDQ
jgi:hypothetical protein